MITDVTAGCAAAKATASSGSEHPMSSASSASFSTASSFAAMGAVLPAGMAR